MKEIKFTIKFPEFNSGKTKDLVLNEAGWAIAKIIQAFIRAAQDISGKRARSAALIIIFGLLFWKIDFKIAVSASVFFAFLAYGWEARIVVKAALSLLIISSVFLILGKEAAAEKIAIYFYYLFGAAIILLMFECGKKDLEVKKKVYAKS